MKLVRVIIILLGMILLLPICFAQKDPFAVGNVGVGLTCGKLISLDFNHIDVNELLKLLAECKKKNLVISNEIKHHLSIQLYDVSWEQAMDAILTIENLQAIERNKIIYIEAKPSDGDIIANADLHSEVIRLHYAKVSTMLQLLQEAKLLSAQGRLVKDERTNSLWVMDDQASIKKIQRFVTSFDHAAPHVEIKAYIVSVDRNYLKELGLNFGTVAAAKDNRGAVDGSLVDGRFNLRLARLSSQTDLLVQLKAIEQYGYGQILASPRLVAANRETANIESGEEIPYQEKSLSGGTSVAFKKAVLGLVVTPEITPQQKIILKLNVSQDKVSSLTVNGVPAISTQEIKTQVLVDNGHTVALGGIFETTQQRITRRLPILGATPLLGHLFRSHEWQNTQRELIIFITPTVIDSG